MSATVYALVDPRSHEIRYVGVTSQPITSRLRAHIRYARAGSAKSNHRNHWINQLTRLGYSPQILVVQDGLTAVDGYLAEVYWISYFRDAGCRLTNATAGGEGTTGRKTSEESRQKMRDAWTNNPTRVPWIAGRGHSTKTRALLSEKAKQQMSNPDQRAAVSRVHSGKTISEEHRKIVSAAQKARWAAWREKRGQ